MKKYLSIGLTLVFVFSFLAGCAENANSPSSNAASQETSGSTAASEYNPVFTDADLDADWNHETATKIQLSDAGSVIEGEGAASLQEGVKISEGGEYVISGKLSDGRIVVDVEPGDPLKLVLNGVDISCSVSAPLYISNGDAVIVLENGTENVLTDAAEYHYTDDTVKEPNACLYGDDNISITGTGKLTVNANFNNGIGTKDELRISSGTVIVKAVNNALKGNDCVLITDADIQLESDGDGIKSDESDLAGHGLISIVNSNLEIISGDDALQAVSSVYLDGGKATVTAKGKKVNCDGKVSVTNDITL